MVHKIIDKIKNKNGSMMMDYFIIAAVGIILLGGLMMFLTEGSTLVQGIVGRASTEDAGATDEDALGFF